MQKNNIIINNRKQKIYRKMKFDNKERKKKKNYQKIKSLKN